MKVLSKWKGTPNSQLGELSVIEASVSPKVIYKFTILNIIKLHNLNLDDLEKLLENSLEKQIKSYKNSKKRKGDQPSQLFFFLSNVKLQYETIIKLHGE